MKNILITGAGSYVGESVRKYMLASTPGEFEIDAVDTKGDNWRLVDYTKYDVVFHVAGIAHVNADPKMEPLYYKVNRDLTIEVARHAKECGVKQFIFMSSQIVFHESQSLKSEVLTKDTKPNPNGFYGDSKLQAKGNFPRLAKLACKVPVFPCWHNKRSMLYIDNLAEFVKQAVLRELSGTFYPQNREQADTVEIIRFFAKAAGHNVWITKLFNPFVWLGSFFLQPINKMFATYYYDPSMSKMDFDYQLVSFEESLKRVADSL